MLTRRSTLLGAALGLATPLLPAKAADRTVTIAYQTGAIPYAVGIQDGALAARTGWNIDFRRFNSGAEIFAAIAGGAVDIGDVGSSPLAASVSNGLGVKAVYITAGAGRDEQLIVRNGSGIKSLADLRGKRLAAAPVSTDHYMLLTLLQQEGIPESEVKLFTIPQPQIVAGWKRGDIDAAFVWNPARDELLKDGTSLLTAAQAAERGAATFTALVVTDRFAATAPEVVRSYVAAIDAYSESFAADPTAWTGTSDNVRKIAALLGGEPAALAEQLKDLRYVPLTEQLSTAWLQGGSQSGVAQALASTAEFLKSQQKISRVLSEYGSFVTPDFARPGNASK